MARPLTQLHHPVVVLARGFGSRLQAVATGRHKTMEHVGDTPILARILHELRPVEPTELYLHMREPDPDAAAVAAGHTQAVHISVGPPTGYLPDVVDCARYGDRFTVVEADTITHPGSLANFLILADHIGADADLCMGIAPVAANPNGPGVVVDEHGLVRSVSWNAQPTGVVPHCAWHWRRSMLTDATTFATEQSTSIADYITWAIPRGAVVVPIGFPAGHNINTPSDLGHARDQVTVWTTLTERSIAA